MWLELPNIITSSDSSRWQSWAGSPHTFVPPRVLVYNVTMPTKREKPKTVSDLRHNKTPKTFTYKARDGKTYTLTEREKRFCDAYLVFGAKGVDAVYEACYNVKSARVAYSIAYENLTKPHIYSYINMHYEEYGFNDEDVMKEHLFLIKQSGDLPAKAKGVDMYYKKYGSYAEEKTAVTVRNYSDLTDEELAKLHYDRLDQSKKTKDD